MIEYGLQWCCYDSSVTWLDMTSWSYESKIACFWVGKFKSDAKSEFSTIKKHTELPRQRFYHGSPKYCQIWSLLPNLVSVGTEIHFTPKSWCPHSRGSKTHLYIIYVRGITEIQPGLSPGSSALLSADGSGPRTHMMSYDVGLGEWWNMTTQKLTLNVWWNMTALVVWCNMIHRREWYKMILYDTMHSSRSMTEYDDNTFSYDWIWDG